MVAYTISVKFRIYREVLGGGAQLKQLWSHKARSQEWKETEKQQFLFIKQ